MEMAEILRLQKLARRNGADHTLGLCGGVCLSARISLESCAQPGRAQSIYSTASLGIDTSQTSAS